MTKDSPIVSYMHAHTHNSTTLRKTVLHSTLHYTGDCMLMLNHFLHVSKVGNTWKDASTEQLQMGPQMGL